MKKKCPDCKKEKLLSEFYKDRQQKNGYKPYCKSCVKKQLQIYYINNKAKIKKRDERYKNSIQGRKVAVETSRRMFKKYPKKTLARQKLYYHVKTGKIKRKPCIKCGSLKVEGHHFDYSKPLDVLWLCQFHHQEIEGRLVSVYED